MMKMKTFRIFFFFEKQQFYRISPVFVDMNENYAIVNG